MDDATLFQTLKTRLTTAVVGDVLDRMGHRRCFLPPHLRPLDPAVRLAGRAMPVLETDIFETEGLPGRGPLAGVEFGLMLQALDDLAPGEVYVAAGASPRYALWGELMATRATHLGAAGAVLDGWVRDGGGIRALGFPCFSRGLYAQDQGPRGKVIDFRCAVEIGGIRIEPGMLLYGDAEGVMAIPREAESEAVARALEKAETEGKVERAIKAGMSAQEAFETFGVL